MSNLARLFHFSISMGMLLMAIEVSYADEALIPVIGPVIGPVSGSRGSPVLFLSAAKLSKAIEATVTHVNESALHSLNSLQSSSCVEDSPWELRTVSVGLGIAFTAGIGPQASLSAEARFRLLYAPNDDFVNP